MNLYIFNETRRGAIYGVGTYIRELTCALKGSDLTICVVNLASNKPQIQAEEIDGIKHWYFPTAISEQQTTDNQKQWELYHRNVIYLLQLHIKDKKGLIFHLNYNQKGQLAEELKKVFDCRIITTIHYFDWCFKLLGNISHFRKILASEVNTKLNDVTEAVEESYKREKSLFEISDHIICLSKNTLQVLHDDYNINSDKITVIYNGLCDINQSLTKQKLRHKYHIPNIPVILFVGRIDDTKGLTYVLQAFKIALNALPNCHIIIVGDGNFNIYMKECEDIWIHTTWTGLISKEKLYDLYSIADIGVMPSFHEQCSYVAIEMMVHGLPIIGSTSTGLKEMIVNGETGLHIPVIEHDDRAEIDSSLLAEKMLYLLHNHEERKRMGMNARKRYEELYSSEIFRKNMLHLYKSLYKKKLKTKENNHLIV